MTHLPSSRLKSGDGSCGRTNFPFENGSFDGWITPENQLSVATDNAHESDLAALQAGFVRVSYSQRRLSFQTIRWDTALKALTTELVLNNAELIDVVHAHRLDRNGQDVQLGCLPLHQSRQYNRPIGRRSMATWNNFKATPA